jgi:acyl-[acyl-carrier-protein]-phospholipid O-acyltransferase/long-chain-fatty-acid--[acyl-carrier-protein] ligase
MVRFFGRLLFSLFFGVKIRGLEHARAAQAPHLIVANHTSFLDGALLYLYLPQPLLFAVQTGWLQKWYLRPFLRLADTLPIDIDDAMAVKSMVDALRGGCTVVIFPEGRMTTSGVLMKVYEGMAVVADKAAVSILPIGIQGPQYSRFACRHSALQRRWRTPVTLTVLPARKLELTESLRGAERRTAAAMQLEKILLDISTESFLYNGTVFEALLASIRWFGRSGMVAEDLQRKPLSRRMLLARSFALGAQVAKSSLPGEHVGVMLPNSAGVVAVFMAMQCCGRVPAMLNFSSGPQSLITAIHTARIKIVYTARRFIDQAKLENLIVALANHVEIVYLEDVAARISRFDRLLALSSATFPYLTYRRRTRTRDPLGTAIILFTSGSEGVPKGVVLSHRNLLANCAQTQALIGMNQSDLVFNALPVFHSFGLTAGMLLPLLYGAKTFYYPTPLHYRIIPEMCYRLDATILFGTNTFLAAYAQSAHSYDFHSLRYVIAGAERLQADTRKLWAEKFGIRIMEGYGATEASPVVAVNTPVANKAGSVGRMISGIEYYLEPVDGVAHGGRLVIRGPNIMRGYLYHGSDGEIIAPMTRRGPGWYDTGDIVDVDSEGYVHILGRAKRFAKVGGEMISLAAVEEIANAAWPEKAHAAVAVADTKKGEIVVLVTQQAQADRRGFLAQAQKLGASELHLPRRFIHIAELPVLGTGKLDYREIGEIARKAMT